LERKVGLMMELICTIPARLGSKRVPRKNLRLLGGKPLIAWTIETAIASGFFDAVYLCTESEEIASVGREYGALVPELVPGELCGDLRPSWEPCTWVAERVAKTSSPGIVCLQPTSPFRSVVDLRDSLGALGPGVDFVVSVTEIDPHFFHWALESEEGHWRMVFGTKYLKERPLLPPRFRPNGSIKIGRVARLLEAGSFFGSNLKCVSTPEDRSIHIGTEYDLGLARALLMTGDDAEL